MKISLHGYHLQAADVLPCKLSKETLLAIQATFPLKQEYFISLVIRTDPLPLCSPT